MVQYNGNINAKDFSINLAWGGNPSQASMQFVEKVSISARSELSIALGVQVFHGIIKDFKDVTSETQGILVTKTNFQDYRVKTQWANIQAAFNIKNENGVFVQLREEDWFIQEWQVFIDTVDDPGDFDFKKFSEWIPGDQAGQDAEVPATLTGRQIFDILETSLNEQLSGTEFKFVYTASAADIVDDCVPEELDWTEGKTIQNALVEVSEKLRLKYITTNIKGQLLFETIDKNQSTDFGDDPFVPSKSIGGSDTYAPEEVVIIGDRDLHEIKDIELERDWNSNLEFYAARGSYLLIADQKKRIDSPGLIQFPPKFMPQNDASGDPPEELPGVIDRFYDPDFADLPAGDENQLLVTEYIAQYAFKKYKLPVEIEILAGPAAGFHNIQDLEINEKHGLISERNKKVKRSSIIADKVEKPQIGNVQIPFVLEDTFIEDYKFERYGGTKTQPEKVSVLFKERIYDIKFGEQLIKDRGLNLGAFIPSTQLLTAVFGVNRFERTVGSGEIKTFHKISSLFNEFIGASQIPNGADDFADEVGNLILSQQNLVNTGSISRIGSVIPMAPGFSSTQVTLDGIQGLQQNISLTDQRASPDIPTSREIELEEQIVSIEQEPSTRINRAELAKVVRKVGMVAIKQRISDGLRVSDNL